jgi:O-antigen/teichoic acid export membrane protein
MNGVRRSVIFSVIDRYATQILLVLTTAVMARLLTPAETGIYVVANAFIMLADNFRQFGVGVYIVQAREVDRVVMRSAFTVTFLISAAICAAIFLSADAIARFYGEPEVAALLRIAVLGFVAIPFASPITSLLQRELAFGALAIVNVAMAATSSAVTVALGLAGVGPASYVWGFVAGSAASAVAAVAARPESWIFRPCFAEVRRLVTFGTVTSAVTVMNMAYEMLPRLAFGRLLGFDAVGIYARAVTVCQLPDRVIVSALQPVVLPAMAARTRAGGDLKAAYLRGHSLMSAVQWPALVGLALLANPVVAVLLGPQWEAVPPLVRVIALANMALAPAFMTFPVLVSVGRIRDTLYASLISLPPSVLIVIGAASFGLTAVAASLFIVAPLQMVVALLFIRRAIGLSWREMVAASRASFMLTLGTALIPGLIVLLSPNGFALGWEEAALAAAGGVAGWLTALHLLDHPIRSEILAVWSMLASGARRGRMVAAHRPD